jgi:acetyl-CoA synthetase
LLTADTTPYRAGDKTLDIRPIPDLSSTSHQIHMDYDAERLNRKWESARADLLSPTIGDGFNMAQVTVDRQILLGRGASVAFVVLPTSGERREVTYGELSELSNQVAQALKTLGIGPGDRVFSLLGRQLEVYLTVLGVLKLGAVFCPLFSSFGPEPVRARMDLGDARILVTSALLYRRKVEPIRASLPNLEHIIIVGDGSDTLPDTLDFDTLVSPQPRTFDVPVTAPESPALLHFTSGTTGRPKGALHAHEAIVAHYATARIALDLKPDDIYWCTADPGWVTGISYGLMAPLSVGATAIVDQREFDAERWYDLLEAEKVNVWYTAPTAIRMMRRLGTEIASGRSYPALRHLASVGEPLEAESVNWGREAFGIPFHDTWWQTETGAIMIGNFPGGDVHPGSMGRPFPGVEAAPVKRTGGRVEVVNDPEVPGELALRLGWPSMFRHYIGETERYRESFADGWYLSGDLVRRDGQGYYWFVGRADDAIQSAGHLIGPTEVERAMMEHSAVADVAAIGKPDPIAFEIVTVAIVLSSGHAEGDEVRRELLAHGRRRLGPAVAPREIIFYDELPKTPSGKVRRRVLRKTFAENT